MGEIRGCRIYKGEQIIKTVHDVDDALYRLTNHNDGVYSLMTETLFVTIGVRSGVFSLLAEEYDTLAIMTSFRRKLRPYTELV